MNNVVWSNRFIRIIKKNLKRNPDLRDKIINTLHLIEDDVFHPSLHTHKLKGKYIGSWACSVDFSYRIIFDIIIDDKSGINEILLLSFGSHDEVY
jgi:addiction module RelE/StbE family toxin